MMSDKDYGLLTVRGYATLKNCAAPVCGGDGRHVTTPALALVCLMEDHPLKSVLYRVLR